MSNNFQKSEACPTSYEINAFQLGDLDAADANPIRLHLRECEFCAAESDFYARFPQESDFTEPQELPRIPEPLRQLAESILSVNYSKSDLDFESLLKSKDED